MTIDEGKSQFVNTWGALGSEWGINRTMAQVHALLLSFGLSDVCRSHS